MKDAFYFPHFSNARTDRKIKRLIKALGIEGYGIYFMLLEVLREQTEFRYPIDDMDLLSDEFGTSIPKIEATIKAFGLFEIDEDEMFFSLNMIKYLEPMFKMKEQRSIAGKASAESRRQKLIDNQHTRKKSILPLNSSSKQDNEDTYAHNFEQAWSDYGRKGSKKSAYNEWKRLSDEDKNTAIKHIPMYVEANESEPHFMKDFERYIKHGTYHSTIIERPRKNTFSGSL
jgi:hypothetical protein